LFLNVIEQSENALMETVIEFFEQRGMQNKVQLADNKQFIYSAQSSGEHLLL